MTNLSSTERLTLQQLRLREWIGRSTERAEAEESRRPEPEGLEAASLPPVWEMTRSLDLHPWQESACDAWFRGDRKGTIKVVTGAGKTVVALAIIERLQRHDPELRVAIVVPTIVLMNQWYDAMIEHSNLPEHALGRLGGGHSDTFGDVTRVLIAVLASARKELPRVVDEDSGRHLLLVGDECHRVGAPEMSRVLDTRRAYSLGLSATPERDGGEDRTQIGAPAAGANDGLGWLATTESHPELVKMVNAVKISMSEAPNGPFYINEYGQVIVPVADGTYYFAGDYGTPLRFEFEGTTLSGEGVDLTGRQLSPGDAWDGPHPGIPYILKAGGGDVYYKAQLRPNVTKKVELRSEVGPSAASGFADRIHAVKGWQGGRFYINEWRKIFAPVNQSHDLTYVYIGHLNEEEPWYPRPSVALRE